MTQQHSVPTGARAQEVRALDDDFPELTCPGCGNDLAWDDLFLSHRVCSTCQRHFPLSSRERLALIVEPGTFQETSEDFAALSADVTEASHTSPASPAQRMAVSRERDAINDTVITGTAKIGRQPVVVIVLDEHASGMTIGSLTTEKVVRAMELAVARRLPLVLFVTGGNVPTASGPLSLVQPNRIAAIAAQLHISGVPAIAVLCESASAELAGALAGQCEIVIAEPDTRIWHDRNHSMASGDMPLIANRMRDLGWIDEIVHRERQHAFLGNLLELIGRPGEVRIGQESPELPVANHPAGRDALQAVRDPERPAASWYAEQMIVSRVELRGDRGSGDASCVRAGIGRIDGVSVVYATLDALPGATADDATVRKLIRVIGVAARFDLPLLVITGRDAGESGDLGSAMLTAKLSGVLSMTPVPVVIAVTGEVRSGLVRALLTGDRLLCQVHTVFGLSGVQPGVGRIPGSGWNLVTAVEAHRLGLVDLVIPEPEGSAARDPQGAATLLREAIGAALAGSNLAGSRRRVTERQQRIRSVGQTTPAGRDALRAELNDLRDLQRNIAKSVEDWRERWDQLRMGQRSLTIQRPDWTDMANRLRTRRAELLERASRIDRHLR